MIADHPSRPASTLFNVCHFEAPLPEFEEPVISTRGLEILHTLNGLFDERDAPLYPQPASADAN
jgi:hypothetical protein